MVQPHNIAVVTDSSSCLPKDLEEDVDLYIVPHELVIEGASYRDGIDINPSQFYSLQSKQNQTCTTSAPKPGLFLDAFKQAYLTSDSVICLTLSSNFSATYESAQQAVALAKQQLPNLQIRLIDSQAAAGAEGLIVLEALRQAKLTTSVEAVCSKIDELIPKVNLIAFVDSLYYLAKSGRIPKISAWAGSLLNIKPLTEMTLGQTRLLAKPRTREKATDRLIEIMKDRVGTNTVCVNIMQAQAFRDAAKLKIRIGLEFNCHEIFVSEFTPVMGAHTGPGVLGVAFYQKTITAPTSTQ